MYIHTFKQFALTLNAISILSSSDDAFAVANTVKIYSSRSTFPCPNCKNNIHKFFY